jgi:hypothetical protein
MISEMPGSIFFAWVGDDYDRIEYVCILPAETDELMGQPGDGVGLAAPCRVLNQQVAGDTGDSTACRYPGDGEGPHGPSGFYPEKTRTRSSVHSSAPSRRMRPVYMIKAAPDMHSWRTIS